LTKLATFSVDRGCSFLNAAKMCLDMIPPKDYSNNEEMESNKSVSKSGFYVSRNRILGRFLVLFAKRKVPLMENTEEDNGNMIDYDPLGLMVLTRPNTGTNPCGKSSADLKNTYKLVASIDDIKTLMKDSCSEWSAETMVKLMAENHPVLTKLWIDTYRKSNQFNSEVGMAARHSKIGMVTGAVLHCLLALEKSVAMRTMAERSMKIIRVKITSTGKSLVGVKYPVDQTAIESLRTWMATLETARNGISHLLVDEAPPPIQPKSISWISTPPKTMKSFFKPVVTSAKKRTNPGANKVDDKSVINTPSKKVRVGAMAKSSSSSKKSKSITSFFTKLK